MVWKPRPLSDSNGGESDPARSNGPEGARDRESRSPAEAQYSPAVRRAALLAASIASFLPPFLSAAINVALPAIGEEFRMSAVLLGWVATSYLLAIAVFLLPFGRLADLRGRRRMFVLGLLGFTIASALAPLAPSAAVLIGFRVAQGVASAMVFGTGLALLTTIYPTAQRGRVLGINVAAVYLGLTLGPFVGGFLTQHAGWRGLFHLTAALALGAFFLAVARLPGDPAPRAGLRFDLPGSVMYGFGILALMYGFSLLPSRGGAVLCAGGLAALVLFIAWERRASSPILEVSLFRRNTVFALSNLAALIHYSATFATGFLLSLYLQYIQGNSPQQAGALLAAQPVVMTLFSPLAGRLSDRVEPRLLASAGMAVTTIGLIPLAFLGTATSAGRIATSLVLLGVGFAFFSSPNTNAIMSSVDRQRYGVAAGTLGTMRVTGQMLSMGIALVLFSLHLGPAEIAPELYPQLLVAIRTGFVLFASLCFAGIFASAARGRAR